MTTQSRNTTCKKVFKCNSVFTRVDSEQKGEFQARHHRHNCFEKQNCTHVTLLLVFVCNVWFNWSRQGFARACICACVCVFGPWQWCQSTVSHWALFLLIISCYSLLSPLIRGQSEIGTGTNGICSHAVGWRMFGCKVSGAGGVGPGGQHEARALKSFKCESLTLSSFRRMCLFDLSWVLISKEEFCWRKQSGSSCGPHTELSHWRSQSGEERRRDGKKQSQRGRRDAKVDKYQREFMVEQAK